MAMMVKNMVGVSAWYASKVTYVELAESESGVRFCSTAHEDTRMTTSETRALAKELYRLARRVDARNASKVISPVSATHGNERNSN